MIDSKNQLNFKSFQLEDPHLSQDFEMSEKIEKHESKKSKKYFFSLF